jgi:hypothetical protein
MADYTNLYTGRGTSAPLPSGEQFQRASERLSDFVTRAEELKYKVYKENEQEFLKAGEIKPEFVLADSARKATAIMMDTFNKKWAKVFQAKANTGGLTTQEKQQMATEKNLIISKNQEDVANYQRYLQMKDLVNKDADRNFDSNEFRAAEAEYINSGRFDLTTPPIKAKSVSDFLYEKSKERTGEVELGLEEVQGQDGRWYKATRTANMTPDQLREFIKTTVVTDPGALKGMINDWNEANPTETDKAKWLIDEDKSGDISKREKDNGILRWATEYYSQPERTPLIQKTSTLTPIASGTRSSKGDAYYVRVGDEEIRVAPGSAATGKTYGKQTFQNVYNFGKVRLNNINTAGATILESFGDFKGPGTSVSGDILSYVPGEDAVIVRVIGSYPDYDSKATIKIKADNIKDINNLPIKTDRGDSTIGAIRKGKVSQPVIPRLVFLDWKKIAGNENKTYKQYLEEYPQ